MSQGRWQITDEGLATEAFFVLIKREHPTKTFSRKELTARLVRPEVYGDFLKLCLEYDDSGDLSYLKKGLKHVIRSIGPSQFAEISGLSRMTLHRMLSKTGNPRLVSLLAVFKTLGLHLWLVDENFIEKRSRLGRPKNEVSKRLKRNSRFHPKFKIDRELEKLMTTQRTDFKKP